MHIAHLKSSASPVLGDTLDLDRLADRVAVMNLSTTPIISFLNEFLGMYSVVDGIVCGSWYHCSRAQSTLREVPDTSRTSTRCLMVL